MATADLDERKRAILDALEAEIGRQETAGAAPLDLVALAVAVDRALGGDGRMPGEPFEGSRELGELNASNDV